MLDIKECDGCKSKRLIFDFDKQEVVCVRCLKIVRKIKKYKKSVALSDANERKMRVRWKALENRAKNKKFGICSYEEFKAWFDLTPNVCHYCKGKMKRISKKHGNRITIDRKDNSLGYLIKNMVKACSVCNTVKNQFLTEDQMLKVAENLEV